MGIENIPLQCGLPNQSYFGIGLVMGFLLGLIVFWIIFSKKQNMEIKNIKTSNGDFPTIIHYENYWEKKVEEARCIKPKQEVVEDEDGNE